jgi:monofunctional chorismate mutase
MPFSPVVALEEATAVSPYFPINEKVGDECPRNDSARRQNKSATTKAMQNWNRINYTARIRKDYAHDILPGVCCFTSQQKASARTPLPSHDTDLEKVTEESEQDVFGSAAECDIAVLQALSRRIHFGKFVAEAKFQSERQRFEKLIHRGDVEDIMKAITDQAVEKKVLERLALKAMVYGRDPVSGNGRIDVEGVVAMYKVRFLVCSFIACAIFVAVFAVD